MRSTEDAERALGPFRLAWTALAALAASVVAMVPLSPANATTSALLVELPGGAPPVPALFGAKVLGPAPAGAAVRLQVYFQPRDSASLKALASAVSTPGNPSYHHFLTVRQFAARFGPQQAQVAAVDRYLQLMGLSVGPLSSNHLAQTVTGGVDKVEAAFGTSLERVRTTVGNVVVGSTTTPRLPVALFGGVAFVGGLDPWARETNNLVRWPATPVLDRTAPRRAAATTTAATGTTPQTTGACSGITTAGLGPAQLAAAYGFSGFYSSGDEGQGETIGLIEYALPDKEAVDAYESCVGSSLTIDYDVASWELRWGHPVAAAPPTAFDPEAAADIEVIAALAPEAQVVVYESNQAGTGLAPWEMAVSGDAPGGLPDVISSSWGSCEADTGMGSAYYQAEQALFAEAATQGQTVLVATGDDGSEGCYSQTNSKALAVDDPSSAPGVTAVGGTSSDTPTGPQYVWNSRGASPDNCLDTGCGGGGAGGGGASSIWPRPSYQPASLPQASACNFGTQGCREIPDVSALAGDPYAQYCSTNVCHSGSNWVGFGGTSLATPSWGAAVLLSERRCATNVGFLNPLLYSEPTLLTGPVTSGNNDLTGTNGGLYTASASGGYSMAAGLGYLGGADLTSGALCGPGNLATAPNSPGTTTTTTTTVPSKPTTGPGSPTAPATACAKPANVTVRGNAVAVAAVVKANHCAGYWVVTQTGDVAAFGSATNYGSLEGSGPTSPIVAIAATRDYRGYWLLASNGTVFAFGDAERYGPAGTLQPGARIVGMVATPDGKGYWTVDKDGGVSAFGDAQSYGSLDQDQLNKPVVGMAATPTGKGYWLVSSDGGAFSFGDAPFRGSLGTTRLNSPVVGITADPEGDGYWIVAADGGVFSFGTVNYGGLGAYPPPVPVTTMAPSLDGKGYYIVDAVGDVFACGDAPYLGSATN
jgi:subtilase family serine protease